MEKIVLYLEMTPKEREFIKKAAKGTRYKTIVNFVLSTMIPESEKVLGTKFEEFEKKD